MLKEKILAHIENKDMDNLKTLLANAEEMEILQAFHDLPAEEQVIAFRLLSKDKALAVFEDLDTDEQQNLIRSFTDEHVIEFVNEMAPDDRVRLLDEMPATVAKKLINSISTEEREATNVIMGYKRETAGRIMTTEFITLRKDMTVEQALDKVGRQAEEKETIYTLFVTDEAKKLEGILTLKDLLIAKGISGNSDGNTLVGDIMSKNAISVSTDADQEEVAHLLQTLDLLAIPVVDKEGRIVGIVTIDDAVDILEDEATEDIFNQAGMLDVQGKEASLSETMVRGNLWSIWKVRVPFLFITLGAGFFGGFIIEGFEDVLSTIVGVAFFIPLIMDMGGNVGTQSSTVFARGIVLGHIDTKRFFRFVMKESFVGLSMGTIFGAISGLVAAFWQGDAMLGIAVGASVAFTMTLASSLGFLVPFLLVKLKLDQAAGSAPLITSVKDVVGLLVYFLFVSVFMNAALQEAYEYAYECACALCGC
ncbi:MAG: magnesium transporter [Defluviitaleaceae bacterium]|nr:magnesium transporter [Defluviitaleaceae bacterium]